MTRSEAVEVVKELLASFPGREVSPVEMRVWREELAPVTQAAALAAIRSLRRRVRWMPTIAEFHEAVAEERARGTAGPAPLGCPTCTGGPDSGFTPGWIEVDPLPGGTHPAMRPCPGCHPLGQQQTPLQQTALRSVG